MKKLFIPVLFIAVLVGCKDDDVKLDVKATLTGASKGWLFESIKVNGVEAIDSFISDTCDKDNSVIFASDGTFTEVGNETKCDSSEPATLDSGSWSLNSDNTELTISSSDSDGFNLVLKKLSVTATNITGEYSESGGGLTIIANVTMKKK
jgi:hypothetical protein